MAAALVAVGAAQSAAAPRQTGGEVVNQTRERIPNPLAALHAQAQAALDKKDYASAAQLLTRYLADAPSDAVAHFELGYADTALERWPDAETEYRKAVQIDPKLGPAQLNLGMVVLRRDPVAAVDPLRQAVQLAPDQPGPHLLLALALERSGKPADALAEYRAATQVDPKSFDAHYEIARVLLAMNQASQAESEFRSALELDPNSAEAKEGLAECLFAQKKGEEGVGEMEAYLAERPNDESARVRLVSILIDLGRLDDAMAQLDRVQTSGPNGPGPNAVAADRLRAQILLDRKQFDEAAATLEQAVQLAPNDAPLHADLGRTLLEQKKFSAAAQELGRALELDPKNTTTLNSLVVADDLSGDWEGALEALNRLEQIEPLPPLFWFIRATCQDHLGQLADAMAAYRKFLEIDHGKYETDEELTQRRLPVIEDLLKHQRK
jgi:superkiller protein 3